MAGLTATLAAMWPRVREAVPSRWRVAVTAWRNDIALEPRIDVAMPDGTRLATSVYLPRNARKRSPAILVRLPYGRLQYQEALDAGIDFARRGYAVVVQDLRGTGESGGGLLPWRHAGEDGVATLEWIRSQSWSDGRVATVGCSALGETQFALARHAHPAHVAMVASGAGGAVGSAAGRYGYFGIFEGGVPELASAFGWFVAHGAQYPDVPAAPAFEIQPQLRKLPTIGLVGGVRPGKNGYETYLSTALADPVWGTWGFMDGHDRGHVPALIINTWGDQTVGDSLALAEAWRAADPRYARLQKVVIAPGLHCGHRARGDRWFGSLPVRSPPDDVDIERLTLDWLDAWLHGDGGHVADWPAYRYFMLVENRWLSAGTWPPEEAREQRWYLSSARAANSRSGDGRLSTQPSGSRGVDRWRYDPMDPVPSRGGPACCTGDPSLLGGPRDQSDVESRPDVLVFTSDPLQQPLRIAGPVTAHVAFASSAPDTDLVMRLVDVDPAGVALNIQEGALRLRYRDGFERPSMMRPGEVYEVDVDLRSIAWTLRKGHRLRLQVTSSSFPRLERNLNTGAANNSEETRAAIAINEVHHGGGTLSWITLYTLPGA